MCMCRPTSVHGMTCAHNVGLCAVLKREKGQKSVQYISRKSV